MTQYKDIPQPTDQRNVSQADILHNFEYLLNVANPSSIVGILPVDHLATGDNGASPSDGFHKQVSFTNTGTPQTSLTNPINGQACDSLVYSKSGNLFMMTSQNNGNNQYQLTTLNTGTPGADKAKFGATSSYFTNGSGANVNGGWTFLPGGLIMNYGVVTNASALTSIPWAIPYPTAVLCMFATYNGTIITGTGTAINIFADPTNATTLKANFKLNPTSTAPISFWSIGK